MEPLPSQQKTCLECGAVNNAQSRFCIQCGNSMAEAAVATPPATITPPAHEPPAETALLTANESSMIAYDAHVIELFARSLYRSARFITVIMTLLGLVLGGGGGYLLAGGDIFYAAAGAVVLGAIGLWLGLAIAFRLRLRAQLALCQVQIEKNTRMLAGNRS